MKTKLQSVRCIATAPISLRVKALGMVLFLTATSGCFDQTVDGDALPRIEIRGGDFVDPATGAPFYSVGFNFARITPHPLDASVGWHATFEPGRYDSAAAVAMLRHLASDGFNTVRVFIDQIEDRGISDGEGGFDSIYLTNLFDFIDHARAQRVYVILTLPYLPAWEDWKVKDNQPPHVARDRNRMYMDPAMIEAKANYLEALFRALKADDPRHLSTVLAVDIINEAAFHAEAAPLNGSVATYPGPDGREYALDDESERKALLDAWSVEWINHCTEAIKRVATNMLVHVSIFTPSIVGRTDPNDTAYRDAAENRIPLDSLAILASDADILGIHFYGGNREAFERELNSIDYETVRRQATVNNKALLVGEFGAIKRWTGDLLESAQWMGELFEMLLDDYGFDGALYWTYDSYEQEFIWNAKEGDWLIYSTLAERLERLRQGGEG